MMTRYSVWLNLQPLHEIDPAIYVLDIAEDAAQMNVSTATLAGQYGTVVLSKRREQLDVTVTLAIREYDTARRKAVMQKIIQWAKDGGWLSISDRPDQELYVVVDELPSISSALKWTESMKITFTAYGFPFWRNTFADTLEGNGELFVHGDAAAAPVDVTVTDSPSYLSLRVAETHIELEGISEGATVIVSHDGNGLLSIMEDGKPIFSKRVMASSDDLLCVPGESNSMTASGGNATFTVKGAWM